MWLLGDEQTNYKKSSSFRWGQKILPNFGGTHAHRKWTSAVFLMTVYLHAALSKPRPFCVPGQWLEWMASSFSLITDWPLAWCRDNASLKWLVSTCYKCHLGWKRFWCQGYQYWRIVGFVSCETGNSRTYQSAYVRTGLLHLISTTPQRLKCVVFLWSGFIRSNVYNLLLHRTCK